MVQQGEWRGRGQSLVDNVAIWREAVYVLAGHWGGGVEALRRSPPLRQGVAVEGVRRRLELGRLPCLVAPTSRRA